MFGLNISMSNHYCLSWKRLPNIAYELDKMFRVAISDVHTDVL
jgi:hypothetical protein